MNKILPGTVPEKIRNDYPFPVFRLDLGNGVFMSYADTGGHGPVVVLLHAFPMWSFSFRKLITSLQTEYRVIAPDHVGFGLSAKPEKYDYSIENHASNLELLMEKLGITELSMVLHGWSTLIGLEYLFRNPAVGRKLVLMNSVAFTGYSLPFLIRFFRFCPWLSTFIYYMMNYRAPAFRHLPRAVREGYLFPTRSPGGLRAFRYFIEKFPYHPENESFSMIVAVEHRLWLLHRCKMALIWAKKDWMYPEKYLATWQKFCPHAKVFHVENKGRFMLETAACEISGIIRAFLRSGEK